MAPASGNASNASNMTQITTHHPDLPYQNTDGITFHFTSSNQANSVALAGTFNSWVGDAQPLTAIGNNRWQTTIAIQPGRHLYKYVVNGTDWIPDPSNPWLSEDGQNNSCLTVNPDRSLFLRLTPLSEHNPGPLYQYSALPSPDWLADAVIYQVFIPTFADNFAGMQAKLSYLQQLGINTLWIMPVQPIGQRSRSGIYGDPYAVADFEAINPRLGDENDLAALIKAAQQQGFRMILDWTLNRSSSDHIFTVQHPNWYSRDNNGNVCYLVPNRPAFAGLDFSNPNLRQYLIGAIQQWLARYHFDGLRFDDSDLVPLDFLAELRAALIQKHPNIALISQSYDELHHLAACDLTYEGGIRLLIRQVADGTAGNTDFWRYWQDSCYSFPRGALRMRWLEEKEQARAFRFFGPSLHFAAATLLLTLDGVPHLLMGQEFNEPNWQDWTSLFDDFGLDWDVLATDKITQATWAHYQILLKLRREQVALRRGTLTPIIAPNPALIVFKRQLGPEAMLITVNLSDQAQDFSPDTQAKLLYYHTPATANAQASLQNGQLAAYGTVIEQLEAVDALAEQTD
jgi:glycosidase